MLKRTQSIRNFNTIDNDIYKVCDGLYLSSAKAAYNKDILKNNSITHIVNAAPQVEYCHFKNDIIYYKLNILDSCDENIFDYFENVNCFINNAINKKGCVLVHCHEGISRAPTICAGYLIQYHKYRYDIALEYLKKCKSNISPNTGFIKQLKEFCK